MRARAQHPVRKSQAEKRRVPTTGAKSLPQPITVGTKVELTSRNGKGKVLSQREVVVTKVHDKDGSFEVSVLPAGFNHFSKWGMPMMGRLSVRGL